MEVKIEAVAKELRHTQGGSPYTGVKIKDGEWINLYGDHRDKKGKTITISEPEKFGQGKSKWARVEEKKEPAPESPSPPSEEQPRTDGQKTVGDYLRVMNRMFQHIKSVEPNSPEARAALINTAMIAWTNGKLIEK